MVAALAANFRVLIPSHRRRTNAIRRARKEDIPGRVPDANVAACAACHGPRPRAAADSETGGSTLSLSHQGAGELGQGTRTESGKTGHVGIMSPVAHSLSKSQIEAVAAYVSYLK